MCLYLQMQNLVTRTQGWPWSLSRVCMTIVFLCLLADKSRCSPQDVRSVKKIGNSINFLVVGDWGRKGLYNQSKVATQVQL